VLAGRPSYYKLSTNYFMTKQTDVTVRTVYRMSLQDFLKKMDIVYVPSGLYSIVIDTDGMNKDVEIVTHATQQAKEQV